MGRPWCGLAELDIPIYLNYNSTCTALFGLSGSMSHHLFLLSPNDTPLYALTHQSSRPAAFHPHPLSSNLPTWSTSRFAETLTALSGAASVNQPATGGAAPKVGSGQDRYVVQMIAHASLDVIEEMVRVNNAMYLKNIDKFNEWTVSAFVTAGNMKFVLLHDGKNEDGIKSFFSEVWELYIKTVMNPFHSAHTAIRSAVFDNKVRASAKKYL